MKQSILSIGLEIIKNENYLEDEVLIFRALDILYNVRTDADKIRRNEINTYRLEGKKFYEYMYEFRRYKTSKDSNRTNLVKNDNVYNLLPKKLKGLYMGLFYINDSSRIDLEKELKEINDMNIRDAIIIVVNFVNRLI